MLPINYKPKLLCYKLELGTWLMSYPPIEAQKGKGDPLSYFVSYKATIRPDLKGCLPLPPLLGIVQI